MRAPSTSRRPGPTRRAFLRGALGGAGLAAVGRLRALPASADALADEALASPFFSAGEREILTQVVERMVHTGHPEAPPVRRTRAVATIEGLVARLDPDVSGQLPLALRLFEWGPFVFDLTLSRFTSMTDAGKDASLEAWMTSRFSFRRTAFYALRNLSFLGYYSQDETWPLIGYEGPLLTATSPGAGGPA